MTDSGWGWLVLFAAFASSLALGLGCAYFVVRWAERRAMWAFAVPFTMWWLVAALSVAVYVFDVRVTLPSSEPPPAGGPLTPRGTIEVDTGEM